MNIAHKKYHSPSSFPNLLCTQVIFNRLYHSGSSLEGGTLLQLINRRNVKRNISGKFNEAIDFFELVVTFL